RRMTNARGGVMRVAFRFAVSVAAFASCLGWLPASAADSGAPAPVARVGSPVKICQLIGDTDWVTGKPTQAKTFTNAGLDAADLGYPVDLGSELVLLFGDSWPPGHPPGVPAVVPPDDSVGVTLRKDAPTSESCLELTVHHHGVSPPVFSPATIISTPPVKQGFFNVPSGGVGVAGLLYAFFWTDHCTDPNQLAPSPADPLALPAVNLAHACRETSDLNSLGRNVMARSDDEGLTFTHVVPMPTGFVYATAANAQTQTDLPGAQRLGVYIFAASRYRASVPYLAYAPVDSLADTKKWRFFIGRDADGSPRWVSLEKWNQKPAPPKSAVWAPPGDAEVFTPASDAERCIGEMSVTWNLPLHMWLMLYQCAGIGVQARIAPAPWGPWSAQSTLLSMADHPGCMLVMISAGCGKQRNYWPSRHPHGKIERGGFYAPYVLDRYTTAVGSGPDGRRNTIIYWVLSTWNPYVVSVMRTTLQTGPLPTAPPYIRPTIPSYERPVTPGPAHSR
ncbi:MAG TPA: DUF4185 domain-containing protein, partial [Vicinamibacterales bacterium]